MKYIVIVGMSLVSTYGNLKSESIFEKFDSKNTLRLDTLKIQTISNSTEREILDSKSMPWVVALLIGLMTVGTNVYISWKNRNTMQHQIKSQTAIAIEQIKNSKELALLEFNKTLNTTNRQEWVIDVRHCISELIAQCKLLNIQFNKANINEEVEQPISEKISYYRTKLLLLLSSGRPNKPYHTKLKEVVVDLINQLDVNLHSRKHNIPIDNFLFLQKLEIAIDAGRDLLYDEWQKIQEGVSLKE